ncbi:General amino acid permease AGP3 [Colletotrichum viniferum]|nr:General amino acid permease AGP3 [Colletotrichum viniferum]
MADLKAESKDDNALKQTLTAHDGETATTTGGGPGLHRGLSGRHLFVGMGTGLTSAGPAGLLLCFTVVGVLLWAVMQSLGELGAFIPLSGSFTHYTSTFVDPAVGFALGWNYWLLWAGIIIAEYNNLGLVLTLACGSSSPSPSSASNPSAKQNSGWPSSKFLAIFAFFLCAILITSGVLGGEKIGFKFYHDPGAFADGAKGVFKVFVFAALQYSGTEMIGLTAGESANPARDVPKAVKSVLWRICGIFLLGIFFLTITVPYNDPNLLSATSKTALSPFVIASTRVGANAGAHVVNAIILVTMFSAINAALYVGSRTLDGLAQEGQAPKIFAWTNKNGVPVVSLVVMNLIGFLSLLNLSSGAGVLISLNHIRLRMALAAQNISADVLPFQAPAWRFCAYLGLAGNVFFIFFQGWTSFAPWDVEAFFQNYVVVLLFIILAVGWKVAKKTKFVNLKEIDLGTARMMIHSQLTGQPQ